MLSNTESFWKSPARWLGVSFQQMNKDLAESFGLPQPKGRWSQK